MFDVPTNLYSERKCNWNNGMDISLHMCVAIEELYKCIGCMEKP